MRTQCTFVRAVPRKGERPRFADCRVSCSLSSVPGPHRVRPRPGTWLSSGSLATIDWLWECTTVSSSNKKHWESVYAAKAPDRVSWFRPHLERSLQFLDAAQLPSDAAVIDVGGGASTFVDDLQDRGYSDITVLDLSSTALEASRARLGERGSRVHWLCANVLETCLPESAYEFWHDRAVFHFLTDRAARIKYIETVRRSLKTGGHIVVATFGPHGPETCSGLGVARFTPSGIHAAFGNDFAKVGEAEEIHQTPLGTEQEFVYCYCRLTR